MDSDVIDVCVANEVDVICVSDDSFKMEADVITDNDDSGNEDEENEECDEVEENEEYDEVVYHDDEENDECDDVEHHGDRDKQGEHFIVSTTEEMREIIDDYCERTKSHFVVQKKSKNFGLPASDCDFLGHQVQWMDMQKRKNIDTVVQFDGIPHICVGNYYLNCQFGVDASISKKMRRRRMREKGELDNVKLRLAKTPSKKCGCPATIIVRQIIKFPQFKIDKNTEWKRRDGAGKLKAKIKECRESLETENIIIGRLPDVAEHRYHEILNGHEFSKEVIHHDVIIKAQELYLENKTPNEIHEALHQRVVSEMFSKEDNIDFKRRRFFPTIKDIHNIVGRFRPSCRFTLEEEEIVRKLIDNLKQSNDKFNIIFTISETNINDEITKVESSSDEESIENETTGKKKRQKIIQTFLFAYQTPEQQRLMRKYCNMTYLLEIEPDGVLRRTLTYRLYALTVQTNVDFQVIGCIIVSKQRKGSLVDGLKILREWNPLWNPKYFLVGCTQDIYDSVALVFPDSNYLLNPDCCERKWNEFIALPSNDLHDVSEELLSYLRNMQYALTEEALNIAAAILEASQVWQANENLRNWFLTTWLPIAKMWVFGYRPEDLLITQHLNSSLDDCITPYKDAVLQSTKSGGLVEMLENVTHTIACNGYHKYSKLNNEQYLFLQSYVKNNHYSEFMQGVPPLLMPYIEGICKLAEESNFIMTCDNLGVFTVQVVCNKDVNENINKGLNVSVNINEKVNNSATDANVNVDVDVDVNKDVKMDKKVNENIILNEKVSINKNGITNEASSQPVIAKTQFGSLEYANKFDSAEYTVSFGDSISLPFCTCSQWLSYRIPCIHMFAVICKVPGWKYDMLSPLYRFSPVFDIDCSCIHHPINPTSKEEGSQVDILNESVGTQTEEDVGNFVGDDGQREKDEDEMFKLPFPIPFPGSESLGVLTGQMKKARLALFHLRNISHLFKKKSLYQDIQEQLQGFIQQLEEESIQVGEEVIQKEWMPNNTNKDPSEKSVIICKSDGQVIKTPIEFLHEAAKQVDVDTNKNEKLLLPSTNRIPKIPAENIALQSGICENPVVSKIIPSLMVNRKRKPLPELENTFKMYSSTSNNNGEQSKVALSNGGCNKIVVSNRGTNKVVLSNGEHNKIVLSNRTFSLEEKRRKEAILVNKGHSEVKGELCNKSVLSILPRMNHKEVSGLNCLPHVKKGPYCILTNVSEEVNTTNDSNINRTLTTSDNSGVGGISSRNRLSSKDATESHENIASQNKYKLILKENRVGSDNGSEDESIVHWEHNMISKENIEHSSTEDVLLSGEKKDIDNSLACQAKTPLVEKMKCR